MYDYKTKNLSFIKIFKFLKDAGVKNNKFFLQLNDAALQGVDPYDPDLSDEMKMRVQVEVMNNFWYFLREIIRIPETGGFIQFQLHRANLAQMFMMENNMNMIEVLPRQHGKTIGAVCRYLWVYHFGTINTNMIFSNKQYADSQLNIKRFNDITDLLPAYLKLHLNPKKDTNNLAKISCDANNNTIDAMSTANDIAGADKLGRGNTVPVIWYDEFAFLKFNSTIYEAAGPAVSKAAESALKNGTPHGILITTTPNDLDTEIGKYCYGMIQDACPFDEAWYDWEVDEVKEFVHENSRNDFVYLEMTYTMLGNGQEWFDKQCRQLNNNMLKIKRELLLEWTLANDTSPFSEEQLNGIQEHVVSDMVGKIYIMNKYKIEIFAELRNVLNKSWLIGIDVGGGLKRDYSAITITDPATMKNVAVFKSNSISVPDLSDLIIELVTQYFPNGVIIPERNTLGVALIQLLLKSPVRNNLYYEVKEKLGEKRIEDPKFSSKRKEKVKTRVYGVHTGSNSTKSGTRDIMFNEILNNAVNYTPEVFGNKYIFEEIRTLERKKTGKIEHRDGGHDDILMSWLVSCYALLYGNNTSKFVKVTSDGVGPVSEEENRKKTQVIRSIKDMGELVNRYDQSFSKRITENFEEKRSLEESLGDEFEEAKKSKRKRTLSFIAGLNK
jgi:hypothetical protein